MNYELLSQAESVEFSGQDKNNGISADVSRWMDAKLEAEEIVKNLDRFSLRGMKLLAEKMDGFLLLELLAQADESTRAAAQKAISKSQSERAKRRRGGCPIKSAFILAMRSARNEGRTAQDFIDAALAGSVEGAYLKREPNKQLKLYLVSIERDAEIPDEGQSASRKNRGDIAIKRSHGGLLDWWSEGGKELPG